MAETNGERIGRGRVCIDTSVAVEIIKGKPAEKIVREIQGYPCISSVTAFELLCRETNLGPVEEMVSSMPCLDFDLKSAKEASIIFKSLKKRGVAVPYRDLMIAATAKANNCSLLTINIRDFENIEGLDLFPV